ncbi:MAG: hypothetical protein ABIL07_07820 [candidate division WOR-3 bacterium]
MNNSLIILTNFFKKFIYLLLFYSYEAKYLDVSQTLFFKEYVRKK